MNPLLNKLQPYPFARLRAAMQGITPPAHLSPIALHIGEPKHATPRVILDALNQASSEFDKYPLTAGLPELRQA
ncbi:MAG: succinyldiaminopimelate transaminase, partial [Neisseria sp.]|nr:succinyldiaminopimelate transaminase [Neisseria sp.]